MAKSYNQKSKLLIVQQMLLGSDEKNVVTMQMILDRLAQTGIRAERKSIYDDIIALREFGYDIRLRRGRNGGYYLQGGNGEKTAMPTTQQAVPKTIVKKEKVIVKEAAWQVAEQEIHQGDGKNVRLLCSGSREKDVRDYFGNYAELKEKDGQNLLVTLPSVSGPQFYGWLTAMGTDVRILKPKKTAAAYRDYLKAIAKEYKGIS